MDIQIQAKFQFLASGQSKYQLLKYSFIFKHKKPSKALNSYLRKSLLPSIFKTSKAFTADLHQTAFRSDWHLLRFEKWTVKQGIVPLVMWPVRPLISQCIPAVWSVHCFYWVSIRPELSIQHTESLCSHCTDIQTHLKFCLFHMGCIATKWSFRHTQCANIKLRLPTHAIQRDSMFYAVWVAKAL